MHNAVDIHICNILKLITDFIKKPTRVGRSTTDKLFLGGGIVQIRLALKNRDEGVILNLWNVFYQPINSSNLVSLSFLNNADIFYNNKCHIIYNKTSQKLLIFAQRWE